MREVFEDGQMQRFNAENPSKACWVGWAANMRFEISKFKFKCPRARTYEMIGLVLGSIEAKFFK